ncbi:GGDEF domain-containing protein [Bacillus sp. JJ1773]|uniref:tetratricopeptide repeat-containing diguanylate cyclase n=1 Tax=Bacillus sp. JJ1773 TaxID=3122965 RepID=UPI002FFF9C97
MEKEDLKLLHQEVTKLRAEGKYKETIEACYNLLKCGKEFDDFKSILTAHINHAASYYCIGDIEEAFNSIDAYVEVCSGFGDEADLLHQYNVLFLLYEYNKDFTKAKATLENSIKLGKKLEKYNIVSNGYSNFSHVLMEEGNYEAALEAGQRGLEASKLHKPASPILELRVKLNIAKAYLELNHFHDSKALINEMIHDPILESFIREKSQSYHLLGSWYRKQKLFKEAFDSLTVAKELVESYQDLYLLKTIQEERCQLCEQMEDVQLGYRVQKEYISLINDINKQELALTALKLEIKHSMADFKRKANTDFLTGTFNRSYLETTSNEWLEQASVKNESIVCILFDIDNFKIINDQYGHLFGDEVIKQVSIACSKTIKENELFARYGGDEFVVMIRGASLERGKKRAEEIREVIGKLKIEMSGNSVSVTTSMGVADNLDGKVLSFHELFHHADLGLYKAKQSGKNNVCVK